MGTLSTVEIHPRVRPGGGDGCAAGALPERLLVRALADARAQGFEQVCYAGEDPLQYAPLTRLMRRARTLGMSQVLVTCGALLDRGRLLSLMGMDYVWVMVDAHQGGACPRGYDWDADALADRLGGLRDARIPFGLSTTCEGGLKSIVGVARVALDEGATALRIVSETDSGDQSQRVHALLAAMQIAAYFGDRLRIELDGFDCADIASTRVPLRAAPLPSLDEAPDARLGELIDRLVVRGDASVSPLSASDPSPLGDLRMDRLDALADLWIREHYETFRGRCCQVLGRTVPRPVAGWLEEYRELVGGFEACRAVTPSASRIQ